MHLLICKTRNFSEAQLIQLVIKLPLHCLHEKWHSKIKYFYYNHKTHCHYQNTNLYKDTNSLLRFFVCLANKLNRHHIMIHKLNSLYGRLIGEFKLILRH